jgi:transcriptional regulator with XRE-family HTH domain
MTEHDPDQLDLWTAPANVLDQLRQALAESGATKREAAKVAGVCESMLSHVLAGRRRLHARRLERLARWLGLEIILVPEPVVHEVERAIRDHRERRPTK